MSSIRTAVNTAEIQLSLRGRTVLKGPGDKQEWLYLSPRMAYWLSSCKCCIGAPLVSSLPRFLCFTTSKAFSISRSLKTQIQAKFQQLHCGLPSSINSLACLHVFGGGWQRRELCITEDLWRCLVVNSFGRGQPSPWGAIHARSFRLWHFNFLWNDNKNINSTPIWETYLSVSPVVSEKLTDSVVLRPDFTHPQVRQEGALPQTCSTGWKLCLRWPIQFLHLHRLLPFHILLPLCLHWKHK